MSELVITDLHAAVGDKPILKGVSLTIRSGEVHAVMGPNGSGKSTLSHVITGKPGYTVTSGSVTLDGVELLDLAAWERARAGLFLAMQYPTEVPGVSLEAMLIASATAAGRDAAAVRSGIAEEAAEIGFDAKLIDRPLNVDLSGGEKKRNETVQLGVLNPKFAILDEIDSGLDVDAMRAVTRRVEEATNRDEPLGVLAITHYKRLFEELEPDHVHVFAAGVIQKSGGAALAEELEQTGYGEWANLGGDEDHGFTAFHDPSGTTTFAEDLHLHEG